MTNAEKKRTLNELWYETEMFNRMGNFLINKSKIQLKNLINKKRAVINAFVESFLIHTRNIVLFLEDKKDIKCSDFNVVNPPKINLPKNNTLNEINMFLAHMTKKRIYETAPDWKSEEILKEVNKHLKIFLRQLPETIYNKGQTRFEQFFK